MNYDKVYKLLAEEAYRMITDECKEKMISLKEPYIESLTEDIKHFTDKIKDDFAIQFSEWIAKKTQKRVSEDLYWHNGSLYNIKKLLEIFKKEK